MNRRRGLLAALAASLALAGSALPAVGTPAIIQSIPSQPYGTQFDFYSEISGRTYRIFVYKPDSAPSPSGYAAIILTDGNVSFPIATIAGLLSEASGGRATLVVGVGYPETDIKALTIDRNRDLTPTQPPGAIQQYPGYRTMTSADFGGAELFYRFLTEELRPVLSSLYPIDAKDQTLAGHSLGGLFTLGVLFNHPAAFHRYVAASPSIWWNNRSVLDALPTFQRRVETGEAAPQILVTAGALEDDVPAILPPGMTAEAVAANFKVNGIVVNARALVARLQQIKGPPGYAARLRLFDAENHNSVEPAAISAAVVFAAEPPR